MTVNRSAHESEEKSSLGEVGGNASVAGGACEGNASHASLGDDVGARAILHDFRQPIQSACAWVDMCRLYLSSGHPERAIEALARVKSSLDEIEQRAAPLIDGYLSTRTNR